MCVLILETLITFLFFNLNLKKISFYFKTYLTSLENHQPSTYAVINNFSNFYQHLLLLKSTLEVMFSKHYSFKTLDNYVIVQMLPLLILIFISDSKL